MQKAVRQAAKAASFRDAGEDLRELARPTVSPTPLRRLTQRVGREWQRRRDAGVLALKENRPDRDYAPAPAVAAVMPDGGR